MTEMSQSESFIRRITKPIGELMVLNAETTGAVLLRQSMIASELVQASIERTRAVVAAKDIGEAFRVQQEFGREVMEKLTNAGRENWNTVRDAYGKAGEVLRNAVQPDAA